MALVSRCCTCAANKNVSSREVVRVRAAQLVGCRAVQLSFATHTPNYITVVSFINFRILSISGYERKTESSSSTKRSSQSPLASLLCVSVVLNSRGVHPPLQPVALPRLAFEIDQFAPGQTDDYGRAGGWPIASPRRDAATPAPAASATAAAGGGGGGGGAVGGASGAGGAGGGGPGGSVGRQRTDGGWKGGVVVGGGP